MNLSEYTFVALDLEATGLDTKNDTIIEVAAVRFHLIREGNIFRAIDIEERSMLVNPGKKLEENISMITGISDKMLEGKPKWEDIRERVREFIGKSIIVGHNVLFDTAMLASHGIDLGENTILDTFELSEIFSQDAESLNLGFLGKKYQIPMESEHRALDDTKLSIELLCRYLSDISGLTGKNLELWQYASTHDESDVFATLLDITELSGAMSTFSLEIASEKIISQKQKTKYRKEIQEKNYTLISLCGDVEEEKSLIEKSLQKATPLLLLTPSKKQAEYLTKTLEKQGYKTHLYKDI